MARIDHPGIVGILDTGELKPENLMLQTLSGGDEQVTIIDFGVAKIKDSLVVPSTVEPSVSGTQLYMSPEQLRGWKVTAASDIYSMGIISYEMITGRRPFNPETVAHLAEIQREGVKVRPKDLRPALAENASCWSASACTNRPPKAE